MRFRTGAALTGLAGCVYGNNSQRGHRVIFHPELEKMSRGGGAMQKEKETARFSKSAIDGDDEDVCLLFLL